MRIMILTPGLPVDFENIKGGVNSATINLLSGFINEDIHACVISFTNEVSSIINSKFSKNIEIRYIPEGNFTFHTLNYLFCVPNKLRKEVKSFKPDLIHYQVGNSFLLSKIGIKKNHKSLLTIHGNSFKEGKIKRKWSEKFIWIFNGVIQKMIYPKYIIHLSNYSKTQNTKRLKEINNVIPNAIKEDYFNIPIKEKTDNRILYIGVIDKNKNLIYLLGVLNTMIKKGYNYSLVVLGGFFDIKYRSQIFTFIKSHNLSSYITFKGWVNQSELKEMMRKSDIVIVSSFYESLPMVIAESMAAGKIVIANNVGGISEMMEDQKSGFLFNIKNKSMLEGILIELYNNHLQYRNISKNARVFAKNKFDAKIVARKTIEFYKKVQND